MGFLNNLGGAFVDAGKSAAGGALSSAANKLPPLLRGPVKGLIGDVFGKGGGAGGGKTLKVSNSKFMQDWRASLFWPEPELAKTDIFKFLPTGGGDGSPMVVWPFTPQVTINYTAAYESVHTVQTNIATPAYSNSNVSDLSVSGEFVANTIADANYVYAVIHFLKSATKSFNMAEEDATKRGSPPPILYFNYLGAGGFSSMPVVITSFNMTYPKEVDYVATGFNKENSMIPAECTITVTLMPAYDRASMAGTVKNTTQYSTSAFIKGDLIKPGFF